jgi:hypothetical protein
MQQSLTKNNFKALNGVTRQSLAVNNVIPTSNLPRPDFDMVYLVNPTDRELGSWWAAQLSAQARLILNNIHAFILYSPHKTSQNPHSWLIRGAWRNLCGARQDKTATGLCCVACLSLSRMPTDGFQFIDFDPDNMYKTIRTLLSHLKLCPYAKSRTAALQGFSLEAESLPLKAFVKWFCESDGICKRPALPGVGPSMQQRQLARDAVARYTEQVHRREETVFEDLNHAISSAFVKTSRASEVLAADLTELPSCNPVTESPFYLQMLEHIEIVRVTGKHASRLGEIVREKEIDSLVAFQCRCCHGRFCPLEPEKLPFVVCTANDSKRKDLMCNVIQFAYHHLPSCPDVPKNIKLKMKRVIPEPKTDEFAAFATYLVPRIDEWVLFVKKEVAAIELAASIPASEHVPIWRPANEFLEDDKKMVSVARILNEGTLPACDSECSDLEEGHSMTIAENSRLEGLVYSSNDVIEGDSDCVYAGNVLFGEIIAVFRDAFFSTIHPEERNKIAMRVVAEIQQRGGSFRSLTLQGTSRILSLHEAVQRSRTLLERGNGNDVIEGIAGACDSAGNRRFRVVVAELRDEFLSTTNPLQRIEIAERVVHKIRNRGGFFLSLHEHGCMRLSKSEAFRRSKVALEKGFSNLLQPQPASGRRGGGSKVLECEVATRYDVLTGEVRRSELVRFPTSVCVSQSQSPLTLPANQGVTQSQDWVKLPTNNGTAQSKDHDRLSARKDAIQRHAQASLLNSETAARGEARVTLKRRIEADEYRDRASLPASNGAAQSEARFGSPTSNEVTQSQARVGLPAANGVTHSQARAATGNGAVQGQARGVLHYSKRAAQSQARVGLSSSDGMPQSLPQKRACLEATCKEIVNL